MRIVWRDTSKPKEYEPIKYRGIYIFGSPDGWEIDVKEDDNIYANNYCARNAIDKYLGDIEPRGDAKRRRYGIQIIGKKSDRKNLGV